MYDELVKRLRDISRSDSNIKSNYIGLTMLQAADAIEELAAKYNKAITDIVNHEKPREWHKRMEVKDGPGVRMYNPIWSCPCCGLDYDPVVAQMINYCYRCGVKIGGVERKEGE